MSKVVHQEEQHRFTVKTPQGSGTLVYEQPQPNRMVLVHTEVPAEAEGQGYGGQLVKAALSYARSEHLKVDPQCPYAAAYLKRHKAEYGELLD